MGGQGGEGGGETARFCFCCFAYRYRAGPLAPMRLGVAVSRVAALASAARVSKSGTADRRSLDLHSVKIHTPMELKSLSKLSRR